MRMRRACLSPFMPPYSGLLPGEVNCLRMRRVEPALGAEPVMAGAGWRAGVVRRRVCSCAVQLDSLRAFVLSEEAKEVQTAQQLRACIAQRLEVRAACRA